MPRNEKPKEKREPRKPREEAVRQPCKLCADQVVVDYKQTDFLKRFMTERGKILARQFTSACATHQRQITRAIKRARVMQLVR
jgi:small subunit ribosomal protein S18